MQDQIAFEEMEHRAEIAKQKAQKAQKGIMETFAVIANASLEALSKRVFLFVALIGTISLFAWVMIAPDLIRLAAALSFSVAVFLPVLRSSKEDADADRG